MIALNVATPTLMGRAPELEMISRAIDAARSGSSAALVVSGEPGIGKTSLLAAARGMARGFQLVAARGIESESTLAYAGLAELLRPLLRHLPTLPAPQRSALEGALALGPPAAGDRFAAYAATLGLLAAASEAGPVLCIVDDAHSMDAPSVEAVLFAARRLGHEGVVVLVATRPPVSQGPRFSGLATMHLAGLPEADARRLLRESPDGQDLSPWVEQSVLRAAGGNPLALRELPRALAPGQRDGSVPLAEPLRPSSVMVAAFRDRLEALPEEARWATLLSACSTDGDLACVLRALEARGGSPADLEAAEAAGVLEMGGDRVLITHPLLRAVVVELAGGRERRAAHRLLGEALGDEEGGERWAWHRAQGAIGPDEPAATALAAFAARAADRGAAAAAAAGFDRAARLTADPGTRAARLLAAAAAALQAGRGAWSLLLAGETLELAQDPLLRERAEFVRGSALLTTGDVGVAHRVLVSAGPRGSGVPLESEVERLALGAYAALLSNDVEASLRAARRALTVAQPLGEGRARAVAATSLALTRVIGGDMTAAREMLAMARRCSAGLVPSSSTAMTLASLALTGAYCEDLDGARREIRGLIDALRAEGAAANMGYPLTVAAEVGIRTGAWPEALAVAQEALVLSEESGQDTSVGFALVTLARLRAAMGHELECRREIQRARAAIDQAGTRAFEVFAASALGLLELGMGRPQGAREHLQPLAARIQGYGVGAPTIVPWRPDLIESLVRLGQREEAFQQLRVLAEEAHRSGSAWAMATVHRCRGLVSAGEHEAHFHAALAVHATLGQPFESARTLLVFGERLRRDRRRAEARALLTEAREIFAALGASPWAERAREELDASGIRAKTRDTAVTDRLTPRELQVAVAVAGGATNREAAARLYLSEKTIERHLGNVYRKLGLRSRSQLARRFATSEQVR